MAWAVPGASGDAHGEEGRREGYVGSRKPLQEGAAHCGGGAIAGGGSTRMSINAKIQFEKQVPLSAQEQGRVKDITKPTGLRFFWIRDSTHQREKFSLGILVQLEVFSCEEAGTLSGSRHHLL